MAATALTAAHSQHITLPGQDTAARITADLAQQVLALDERRKQLDRQIRDAFHTRPRAPSSNHCRAWARSGAPNSLSPGDLAACPDAGHLTSAAGLVLVAKDSGRCTDNLHRPSATPTA
ncbi:hypothetical protein ACFZDD_21295 [Streptomyces griseorubiginosus]|uniref:hypothetical protein n=1 Tax=Streptomyces griseorubiginosus TaxID=67304 RepID=UPI0036E551F0